MSALALDCAKWQASIVDYAALVDGQPTERAGLTGPVAAVVLKATEAQGWRDPSFPRHVDGFGKAGVEAVAAYTFAHADADPKVSAKFLFDTARPLVPKAKPCIDVEGVFDRSNVCIDIPKVGAVAALRNYRVLAEESEQLWGCEAVIYTGPGFIATWFGSPALRHSEDAEWLGRRLLWLAHYTNGAPLLPLFWQDSGHDWWMHQYSGTGKIVQAALPPGVKGTIDLNECRDPAQLLAAPAVPFDPRGWMANQSEPEELNTVENVLHLVARPGGQEVDAAHEVVAAA